MYVAAGLAVLTAARSAAAEDSARPEPPAPVRSIDRSLTIRLQGDSEGALAGRVDARYGPSRWLLLGGGVVTPVEERIAPAGYRERRYTPDQILGETWTAIGAAAGPVTFGPLSAGGVIARAIDPTAGGWSWGALTDRDRFTLDASTDEPSRRGLALTWMPAVGAGAGAWALEDRDGTQWRGAALSAASGRALPGRVALLLGETLLPADPRDEATTSAEGWLYRVPPLRTAHYLRGGVSWRAAVPIGQPPRPGATPPHGAARELSLLAEAWAQREGRAPIPWAYTGVVGLTMSRWEAGVRLTRAAPGFLDAWGDRVDRSLLLAAGFTGRWGPPADRRSLGGSWELPRGWEEGVPAPPRQDVAIRYRRGTRDRVIQRRSAVLSAEVGADGDLEATDLALGARVRPPRRRGRSQPAAYLDGEASVSWERGAAEPGWELSLGPGWSRAVGRHRRTLSVGAGVALGVEPEAGAGGAGGAGGVSPRDVAVEAEATVPIARGGRVAFDLDYEDEELRGRLALEWRVRPSGE